MNLTAGRGAGRRALLRYQSTTTGSSSSAGSYVAAGVAGGAVVILAGYTWYHVSGTRAAVNTARSAADYYQQTKRTVVENAPKNPNEVIEFFRKTAKTYAGLIPGAGSYIDSMFDTLDQLHETHGEDVNKVLQKGYDDVTKIIKENDGGINVDTGMKIMEVLNRSMNELQEVGKKAGQDAFKTLTEKHPEIGDKLGGGYEQLKKMAEKSGPEAKKVLDETTQQIKDIFSKGFGPGQLNDAQKLIQSKTAEITKAAQSSSQDAWNEAVKQAQPYLDKLPDIKKLIEDNASALMGAGVSKEVFAKVKEATEGDASKNKQKVKDLQEFVKQKAEGVQKQSSAGIDQGWTALQGWIKTMPGGEEALKKMPDMDAFVQLAQQRGDDAKQLTKETYDEIVKVLEEKGKRAKELAEKTQQDAKKKS